MVQVSEDGLNHVPSPEGNSIAMIVRHITGNLKSRFTDFLTSDGEKSWRDRESEFLERLKAIRGERMTIIISTHRLSLLSMVDRLLLFDSGRLVADGPRDKVLAILQGKPVAAPAQPNLAQTATVVQKPNAAV